MNYLKIKIIGFLYFFGGNGNRGENGQYYFGGNGQH